MLEKGRGAHCLKGGEGEGLKNSAVIWENRKIQQFKGERVV